jgi:hypothetical protein
MLRRKLIFIAILSIAWLLPQRSIAQSGEMCTTDPNYGPVDCQGGTGCTNYSVYLPMYENYGEGFAWYPSRTSCTGHPGCYATDYTTDYETFCYGTELKKRETLNQLAELASERSVIVADCQGHFHQYGITGSLQPTRAYGKRVLR